MEKRPQVISIEEYIEELVKLAPASEVEEFKRLWKDGKRIHAIQILRKYNIGFD